MKKKIKDLTISECKKICNNQEEGCLQCPLFVMCMDDYAFWREIENIEKEVEV